MRKLIFIIVLFPFAPSAPAQVADSLLVRKIDSLARVIYSPEPDSVKIAANNLIRDMLADLLSTPQSLTFPYDSLNFAKTITSADQSFRLVTWTIPLAEDRFGYLGFYQKISKSGIEKVIELIDRGDFRAADQSFGAEKWPGAVYYNIIENKSKSGNIFTLFGWVGAPQGRACRVIESLTFDESGLPVFGFPVFETESGKLQHRVIFEFTAQVPFHLAYEQHRIPGKGRKKSRMIVYNRLGGNDPALGRFFDAPVPSYSTFDGFVFTNHKWKPVKGIDTRVATRSGQAPKESGLFPEK